jgi:hypothetical protein
MSKEMILAGSLSILLLTRAALGCSMIVIPISQFDSAEYIFTGKVVGFTGPQKLKYVAGESWGVLVKAAESVHSPKTPTSYFEVFPADLDADCSSQGRSKERVSGDYPLGSQVLVIAKEAKFDAGNSGNVKLVITPASNSILSTIGVHEDPFLATSVYDYRTRPEAQTVLPVFEMRKDLLRLSRASSEAEKEEVLRRLVYFPPRFFMDYKKIVELHLQDKAITTQLIAEREAWKQRLTSR